MRFRFKCALLALPALALAAPGFAQVRPVGLSDSQEPGSVIVFPKFINAARVNVDGSPGVVVPRTEIEIGAVCPPLAQFARNVGNGCNEHATVKVRFHWVCPGFEGVDSNICHEQDFDVVLSINGKLVFAADGIAINGNSPVVPAPLCPRGYLIGWVIAPAATTVAGAAVAADAPIKFDALIGDAVIRGPLVTVGGVTESTAVSAYQAITIQANATDPIGFPLGTGNSSSPLFFEAGNVSGTYQAVTGVATGDVKFDQTTFPAPGAPGPGVLSESFLTLLTLDVRSDQPNNPTAVLIDWYNESDALPSGTNPNFERLLSDTVSFVCWTQIGLASATTLTTGNNTVVPLPAIDPNLTQGFMGTRKGVFIAGPATKFADGHAPQDGVGSVTLLAVTETEEGTLANGFGERKYNFNAFNDSFPVNTVFCPDVGTPCPVVLSSP
jgi:hypothetical protein